MVTPIDRTEEAVGLEGNPPAVGIHKEQRPQVVHARIEPLLGDGRPSDARHDAAGVSHSCFPLARPVVVSPPCRQRVAMANDSTRATLVLKPRLVSRPDRGLIAPGSRYVSIYL